VRVGYQPSKVPKLNYFDAFRQLKELSDDLNTLIGYAKVNQGQVRASRSNKIKGYLIRNNFLDEYSEQIKMSEEHG